VARHFTRDGFRAPEEFSCGVMLTTEEFRKKVWDHFSSNPDKFMTECNGDDQVYFRRYWNKELKRFQDEWPDAFVSYKLNVLQHGLTEDATFLVFHGKPRPWDIDSPWVPKCSHPDQSLVQVV
jgi:hypothetical protein